MAHPVPSEVSRRRPRTPADQGILVEEVRRRLPRSASQAENASSILVARSCEGPGQRADPPNQPFPLPEPVQGDREVVDTDLGHAASRAVVVPRRGGNVGIRAGRARQNRKRVRPPGSVPNVTIAERGSMRYTFHGGGPCDGALNGAVMPDPLSSGSAGQPLSAHAFAIRASAPGSVTRVASPSITTSASRIDTAIEHRGSRATLRPFRVPAPVWNQNVPSSHMAPTAVTCGLPSSLTVDSQVVRESTASAAGADPASSFSTTAAQSTGGSPSALPRLVISMRHPFIVQRTSPLTTCRR